ncbi:MAG TPA: SAM-dependent chlorinase/fluorinase [Solirubrobacteraceae bacterium]|nr:SAM-dependent chlorinase/fluorinase [Solirubrobacteraceae bacterium]
MSQPVVTFLSDYGLSDDFVGVCHGVIARRCPEARVIDLTHGVPRGDVRAGALILRSTLPYLADGVVLAVVDPGVGSQRRAVALRAADGRLLVGPDNGLLSPAAAVCGGAVEAVDIGRSGLVLQPVSTTFHGRDIFAPVAAGLAAGAALSDVGSAIDPSGLVELQLPRARVVSEGVLVAHAVYVDGFGNVQLDVEADEIGRFGLSVRQVVELTVAGRSPARARYVRTFADARAGELLLYSDSYARLAVAVNRGSAASRLGLAVDHQLRIRLV